MTVSNLLLEENERALKTRPKVSKNPKNRRTELLEKNTKPQDSMRLEKRSLNAQAFFFQQMVESSNALFYSISPEGEINYLNPEGLRKIGQEFLEIKGENFLKLIPRKFRKSVMEHYQLIMDNNQLFSNLEFPILDHAGKEHWLRHQVRLQLNDNDEVTEIFGAAFDISTHKKTEAEFQRTQQRLASLVTNLPGGVLVENERGEIIIINEFFCNIFNIPITAHWLKGKNCTEFMNNIKQLFKEPAAFLAQSKKLGKERKQVLNEEWTLADGRIIKCDYIPVFEEGLYMGSYYSFWDVTEERHSAVKLKNKEEKYRSILGRMQSGIVEFDLEGNVIYVNEQMMQLTGYDEAQLKGRGCIDFLISKNHKEEIKQKLYSLNEGNPEVFEAKLKRNSGELFWSLVSAAPRYNIHRKIVGATALIFDITGHKRMQGELKQAKQNAEESQKAQELFLASMSHEIRTPLNAVIGMLHLLEDTELSSRQEDYLTTLRTSANILHGLISDVLDISKIEAGKMEVQPKEFDLHSLVTSLQKTFQMKMDNKPVEIDVSIDERIENMVIGDDLMLNQILLNLLGNAEKFTQKGNIGISVRLVKKVKNDLQLEFKISDTGIGIEKDHLVQLFQNFKQASQEIKLKYGGTGLGLAIIKKLIELQGGTVEVESKPDVGTMFTFNLTYKDAGRKSVEVGELLSGDVSFDVPNAHVLVVEDNYMNRKYIKELFRKWEVKYEMASNGKEALKMLKEKTFDLVFMDIQMPIMDGYETVQIIRQSPELATDIPIVALTASALISQKNKSLEAGMNDYLAKPFAPAQLLKVMKKYLPMVPKTNEEAIPVAFEFSDALDNQYLQMVYEGDLEYASDIFETFLTVTTKEFPKLLDHAEGNNWQSFRKLAHKLKPNFSMVGLTTLGKAISNLENLDYEHSNKKEVIASVLKIRDKLDEMRPLLLNDLNKMNAHINLYN